MWATEKSIDDKVQDDSSPSLSRGSPGKWFWKINFCMYLRENAFSLTCPSQCYHFQRKLLVGQQCSISVKWWIILNNDKIKKQEWSIIITVFIFNNFLWGVTIGKDISKKRWLLTSPKGRKLLWNWKGKLESHQNSSRLDLREKSIRLTQVN